MERPLPTSNKYERLTNIPAVTIFDSETTTKNKTNN